ncbi:MAG: 1-deoxy-D-xylulose-5-phosphate reductoisomerase [Bacteroidales bacterium]|jgi:1-deoxy-D-xylulose-5-phosphate reductoisomerase|nr:1-deoxy-D-xylulose-5-phosphate reductoisomerase [Bacteroidales bacterium]MBR2227035.1 1-deoxy-D-xylulose-5-phosphate reductoisomerase [Bacteroidales bacterium]MBR2747969.1 1-deoxy-D-xylulose-5-phosphate reductoisomerase [Bacteroidales bacterium]MBR3097265.1 1-deoxy-D-xylulose-5-phosphate reductoisomerase [Bacteroidales bacterium]MBR4687734.1 1-deoxy-D-xylulose-5-phosphate reductoisomerase [Bacteroidales bacterium]
MQRKRIAILGSTGSIGRQTLDVVRQHPDRFEAVVITAGSNAALLAEQARAFDVPHAVICNTSKYGEVCDILAGTRTEVHAGIDAACDLVTGDNVDIVVASMVGFSGLRPTLSAIRAGKDIALANKETLVAAGSVVMAEAQRCGVKILPVDSEHSAIFQCLQAAGGNPVERIHLTASGGPFRTWPREKIEQAGKDLALKHPNWSMGAKITIDSATMMNKGFEVIEAKWLFDVEPERIHVVVHPESVIHSMVEFADGAVLAQLGCPDMREPIQLALSYPERLSLNNRKLDFSTLGALTFFEPDLEKFPCLKLAFEAIGRGGNLPCALNAANEAAVAAYLEDKIGFYDIAAVAADTLACTEFVAEPSLDDIFATNEEAFARARKQIW